MTTSAKEELKQGISNLSEMCKRYIEEIKEKDNRIAELEEKIEHEKETRRKLSAFCDKSDSELKEDVQKLKSENETLNKEIQKLKNENEILNKEIHKLKNESKTVIHNERGAGRKQRLTEEQKETIKMYRVQGKTIKEIAEIFNCSIGLIHKLINESK